VSKDTRRAARLNLIQFYLHKHLQGLTTKESASMCDTTMRTTQRYLQILGTDMHIPNKDKGHDRYGILKDCVLPPVAYSLFEAMWRLAVDVNLGYKSIADKLTG
jgi:hypothetical protein